MSQPRRLYGALLALLLVVVGISAGASPATASPRPGEARCDPFLSDIRPTGNRLRFQGQVTCNVITDVISIEVRIVPLSGKPSIRSRFVRDSHGIAFLTVERRCTSGTYAGTLAADAYVQNTVVASVREATQWFEITC
jgi:hypothetical protein